jgi:hypothetical protein
VFRFLDGANGTHFYTASHSEFAGLTTQGTSTYRADLHFEGVSFYAPSNPVG